MRRSFLSLVTAVAVFVIAAGSSASASSGVWSFTGSMHTARIEPLAATLPDGRVLVAGGFNNPSSFRSAELFNPQTGVWSQTRSMSIDRVGATMTVLATGAVLVAGGSTSRGITKTCELFDPATGRWSRTGSMFEERYNHTATLLANGPVLVAGGIDQNLTGKSLNTAELYDPRTGTWTRTGSMASRRESHAAALLTTGDVLVTGGNVDIFYGSVGSAELFNPSMGRWTSVGRMTTSRSSHTETLLPDGSVLIAGGIYGNIAGGNPIAMSDRYDPMSRQFSPTGDMQVSPVAIPTIAGRYNHHATALADGRVLVTGGVGTVRNWVMATIFESSEIYDPANGAWTLASKMNVERSQFAAVALLDGRTLAIGGGTARSATRTAEIFSPPARQSRALPTARVAQGRPMQRMEVPNRRPVVTTAAWAARPSIGGWTATGSLHFARAGAPVTLLDDGRVLIEGCERLGFGGRTAELYDPASGKWSLTGSMHFPRCNHVATLLADGSVLVAGGDGGPNGEVWSSVEIYDPTTAKWTLVGRMNSTRFLGSIVTLAGGKLLFPAGAANNTIPRDSADRYDPASNTWSEVPSLNISRYDYNAVVLTNGKVLVEGGFTQDAQLTNSAELYDPIANLWAPTGATHDQALHVILLQSGLALSTDEPGNLPARATSELYDAATGKWTPTAGRMHFTRVADSVTLLTDGRALVAGGCTGLNCTLVAQAEIFDPLTSRWSLDASLRTPRYVHSAVRLADGRVLVAGGLIGFTPIASAEIYTP